MASQPLAFGELLFGGVLLTMGLTGSSVREVITGKAKHIGPIAAGHGEGGEGGRKNSAFLQPGTGTGPNLGSVKGAGPGAERLIRLAESQKGVQEGSEEQAQFAHAAGISAAQAWCAAFVTWTLKKLGYTDLPTDPASVSSWESWAGGKHISGGLAAARPGDLLAFNGQHIGIYLGAGRMISGNWSNEVAIAPVSQETEPITDIIRIKGLGTEVVKALGRGASRTLGWKGMNA